MEKENYVIVANSRNYYLTKMIKLFSSGFDSNEKRKGVPTVKLCHCNNIIPLNIEIWSSLYNRIINNNVLWKPRRSNVPLVEYFQYYGNQMGQFHYFVDC